MRSRWPPARVSQSHGCIGARYRPAIDVRLYETRAGGQRDRMARGLLLHEPVADAIRLQGAIR